MKDKSFTQFRKGQVVYMNAGSELTEYMNGAVTRLITNALRATLKNPKETAFIMEMRSVFNNAGKKRLESEERGVHIPAFLISSITNKCNLYCKGCYARENHICGEVSEKPLLTAQRWQEVFKEAAELGIAFNLLAGGEPLLRKEVILEAAKVKKMIFPIFTNGLMINEEYLSLFSAHRNLIPVISMEGEGIVTDARRGSGTYEKLIHIMKELQNIKILYGTSITVTSENIQQVSSPQYINSLADLGCRLVFFIEYVPVSEGTQQLALSESDQLYLEEQQRRLREEFEEMIFLSFPGDEKYMGGCLAAGRGFFHINPYGGAEPCPFSPYSDTSLTESTLYEALQSPLFRKLSTAGLVGGEHKGGCALFEHENEVRSLVG